MQTVMHKHRLLIISAVIATLFLVFPQLSIVYLARFNQWVLAHFASAYIIFASMVVLICLGLALSPIGKIKLGSGAPEFSLLSWLAMLFTAGMGSGLVFWGVAEPVFHYANPPAIQLANSSATLRALALSYFHWGLHAWSLYAITALIIAWFVFMHARPMRLSSVFASAKSSNNAWQVVDLLAILAIIFGLAGTIANSVALVQTGLEQRFELQLTGSAFGIAMTILVTIGFSISLGLGLKRGIQYLSGFNMILMCALLLVVMWQAGIDQVLARLLGSAMTYIKILPQVSFAAIQGSEQWSRDWTVIYLIWWIAWAPFVGPFIARISRGRSVRQFILCTVLIPTLASMLWFSSFAEAVFGSHHSADIIAAVQQHYTNGLFALFAQFPMGATLAIAALILLITFVITSADSAIYVICMLADDLSAKSKGAWVLVLLAISLALVGINNVDLNKQIAISGAIPFTLVLIWQLAYLLFELQSRHALPISSK